MKDFAPSSAYPMIPFEDALAILEEQIRPLEAEQVSLNELNGLVLAENLDAVEDVPSFAASTMDGYAIIASDTSKKRKVLGEQEAGHVLSITLEPGTCLRIMTGAPLPAGADAVIPVEQTSEDGDWMRPETVVAPGQNVRPIGSDLAAGQRVLNQDTVLGPAEIGLLATLGIGQPMVYPRPRVAILATGDELVAQDRPLEPGQIRDSNSYSLAAAVQGIGCQVQRIPRIADTKNALRKAVEQAMDDADLLVTTGGVSMGTRDLVKPVLEEMGTVHFGRVAVQPGKPLTFASVGGVPVIGLPGNPVSTLVGFEVVVRPVLRIMAHRKDHYRPERTVRITHAIRHAPERLEFQRARLFCRQGLWWATTTGSQASSRLLSLVGADALLRIPRYTGNLAAGAQVQAILINEPEIEEKP